MAEAQSRSRILIADDNAVNVELLEAFLADGDYETIAGLVIDAHGALPVVGDGVDIELMGADDETAERVLRAEVLAIEHYVPSRLRLTLPVRERSEGEEQ